MTIAALLFCAGTAVGQTVMTAGELGFTGLDPDLEILILESDPTLDPLPAPDALPVPEPADGEDALRPELGGSEQVLKAIAPRGASTRVGCQDQGFSNIVYARDTGNDWRWLPANFLVADDLTLIAGTWTITCYDVLIYADNDPNFNCNRNRTITLRAYDACNGNIIPNSTATYTVPPHGGPVLLTSFTGIDFQASGTIWLSITTSINACDGWYIGMNQVAGTTASTFQFGPDCNRCIDNSPNCTPWEGFLTVLYGEACNMPAIAADPADGALCDGQPHPLCVTASGTGPLSYQWYRNDAPITGAESACHDATTDGLYHCVVSNVCDEVTSATASVVEATAPSISDQPVGGTICAEQWHDLCVSAVGGMLSYQWYRDGGAVGGATATCYPAVEAGDYHCVVSNPCGSLPSDTVTVNVNTPPAITTEPQGGTVCSGDALQFCVAAEGSGPLSFRWKRNGLPLIGATDSCYYASAAGSYTCTVSNDCGATDSSPAILHVGNSSTGDFDGDGDLDLQDHAFFAGCLQGPAAGVAPNCRCADVHGDGDVDLGDFATFQTLFSP